MKPKIFDVAVPLVCFFYGLSFSLINIARFRQFQSFYYDFGIFAKTIYQISRFKVPIIDHYTFGLINEFADHFDPGIGIFSPLFWLTKNPEILLVVQVIFVALSGYILYLTSKVLTKNNFFSFGVILSYLLFLGLQNALIADFHPEVTALLPISLSLYFLAKKKIFLYFLFLIISFTFKESIALFALYLGIFLILSRNYKHGFLTFLLGIAWLAIIIKFLIPFLSPEKRYFYAPYYPTNLLKLIINVVDEAVERKTLFTSLASFSFLPLFSPPAWILAFGDFIARFAPESSVFGNKDLTMHYSAIAAFSLAFATIWAYSILKRLGQKMVLFFCLALIFVPLILISRPILNGPINLIYNPDFFRSIKNHQETELFLAQTPKEGIIMTHNSLAVRFPDRELQLLRQEYPCYQPNLILINAEAGQNPNNFWELNYDDVGQIIQKLKEDSDYELSYQQNNKYIFSRITDRQGDFTRQGILKCTADLRGRTILTPREWQ